MDAIQFGRVRQALDQLKGLPVVVNRLGTSKEPPRPFRRFQRVVECLVPRLGSEPVIGQWRHTLADRRLFAWGRTICSSRVLAMLA